MDLLPYPLAWLFASGFLVLLSFVLLLNIFGLPANWMILGLVTLWKMLHPVSDAFTVTFWAFMIALALLGEILEWGMQVAKAKSYGSSSSGTFAGMLGAFAGAIFFAPLFFGFGALLGAMLGAWIGCFVMELFKGRHCSEAFRAAFGAMLGRFMGTVCKCGVGGCMLALTAQKIYPVAPNADGAAQVLNHLLTITQHVA